ncbi:hypothetical protein [Prevotella sp. E2-28]|uniref:hypothetical protein n=1 Tax=Prevotella sp. E2-28 TaxID=2913620 RepID=UPI001EDBC02A|nr:hypothetical protein [Prevotella sp. E2-28]UKK54109.1 hypothetical protein L6465_02255 [Prevotella sp. E2-28]
MKRICIGLALIATFFLMTACGNSRKDEIEARKAALKHKQDSTLNASQQELAVIDSVLEAVKAEYEQKKKEVEAHKAALQATPEELTELTLLRVQRDSLQVKWNVLGAKIRYVRQKQKEME